ncbi:MAG: diacylglycerol/polyprenol kinase family protein [Methanomicrobiales archaeon]
MEELTRQAAHMAFGVGIAAFVALVDRSIAVPVFVLAIFCGCILSDAILRGYRIPLISFIVGSMERAEVLPGKGALFFTIGSLLCLVFFGSFAAAVAILTLAVLDSIATAVGIPFGRTRIANGKSLEGTGAAVAVVILVLLPALPPAAAVAVAVAAGAVELLAPVDDNLVVPVAVCLVMAAVLPGVTPLL